VTIAPAAEFPSECDALWEAVAKDGLNPAAPGHGLSLTIVRDRKYLNWRFVECPVRKYHILLARRQGRLSGYAVLRTGVNGDMRRGYIVDLLALPQDRGAAAALLRESEKWFREQGAQVVQCLDSDKPSPWLRLLARFGFWFRKRDHHLVAINGIPGHSPQSGLDAPFRHVSYADGELDFVS
jgi:Acetyltransferase (GNAT) family